MWARILMEGSTTQNKTSAFTSTFHSLHIFEFNTFLGSHNKCGTTTAKPMSTTSEIWSLTFSPATRGLWNATRSEHIPVQCEITLE